MRRVVPVESFMIATQELPADIAGRLVPKNRMIFDTKRFLFPIIGEHEGIGYAMGYCGHGVAVATYFGFKLADMILGKGLNTVFTEKKSIPIPLYRGNPWFLPIAHNYFRFLDLIKQVSSLVLKLALAGQVVMPKHSCRNRTIGAPCVGNVEQNRR